MSNFVTKDLPRDHAAAFRVLAQAMRAVGEPDSMPCRLSPESYWPSTGETYTNRDAAVRGCETCPVRVECAALGRFERRGIWGGLVFQNGRAA